MAITYVAEWRVAVAGSTATNTTFTLSSWTTLAPGDLVVVCYGVASTSDRTLTIRNQAAVDYTLIGTELYSNSTQDSNLRVAYRIMPNPVDTQIVLGPTGATGFAGGVIAWLFKGVDNTTPLDVAAATATGTNTGVNPPARTPVTAGAVFIEAGMCAHTDGLGGFVSSTTTLSNVTGNSTQDATVSMGRLNWTSGAVDPAVWTAAAPAPGSARSWAAMSFVLRPGPTGKIKAWNGSSFLAKPVKYWNGSAWVTKPLKRWNGSAWVQTNY
jgi:hypothetical protein